MVETTTHGGPGWSRFMGHCQWWRSEANPSWCPQCPGCRKTGDCRMGQKKARKEILCISDEHRVHIDDAMTRHEIWAQLQDIFESRGAISIVNLCWEHSLKMASICVNKYRNLLSIYSKFNQQITHINSKKLLKKLPIKFLPLPFTILFISTCI